MMGIEGPRPSTGSATSAARVGVLVWAALVAAALALLGLTALPVAVEGTPLAWLGTAAWAGYSPFCHQDPERSFHIHGVQLLACSRCVGVIAGAGLGLLLAALAGRVGRTRLLPPVLLAIALAPLALDALLGLAGVWSNTFVSRTATGLFAGALGAFYLLPAATRLGLEIVEQRRDSTVRRVGRTAEGTERVT